MTCFTLCEPPKPKKKSKKPRKSKRIQRDFFKGLTVPVIIAIDPGEKTGISVVTVGHKPRLLHSEIVKFGLKRTPERPTEKIAALAAMYGARGVVIEDQYFVRNPNVLKVMARRAGRWEEAALHNGLPVEFVGASTWQGPTLSHVKKERGHLKDAAQVLAKIETGIDLSEDQSDAYCIGRYVSIEIARRATTLF